MIPAGLVQTTVFSILAIVPCARVWDGLTGVLWPQGFFGFVPHGLAVLLQLVESRLPPRARANLHKLGAVQKKIQIRISGHACGRGRTMSYGCTDKSRHTATHSNVSERVNVVLNHGEIKSATESNQSS